MNGARHKVDAPEGATLLEALRDGLGLTGTKYGCGEGQCGACTVLIDGRATRSCITPLTYAEGKSITTVEGLERGGQLHPVQQAMLDTGAMQCGYCTSGMVMSGVALLSNNPRPTDAEVVRGMDGNICLCGTYPRIVAAVRLAASRMKGGA